MNELLVPIAPERRTHSDTGAGEPGPLLLWRFPRPVRAISSAMLGGGIGEASWVINAHVRSDYSRMDPADHLRAMAGECGLPPGAGIGLMTAARIELVAAAYDGPAPAPVRCDVTVGVSYPTWAAAPDGEQLPVLPWRVTSGSGGHDQEAAVSPWRPGTINIVCQLPVHLTDAALVGAVLTATEAKTQALIEAGVPGTGTASDAIVVCVPPRPSATGTSVPFAGPRSIWGARLARAVHIAVTTGLENVAAVS